MDFELSADEVALQEGVRKLCEGRFPVETVRALLEEVDGAVDRARWRELAEAGVFSLRLPEASGGAGLGMAESVLVFEELGRALVPGPLVASHLAASLLPGAADGSEVIGLVQRRDGTVVVEHLDALDTLLVVDNERVSAVDPSEIEAEPVDRPLDPLTPVHVAGSLPAGEQLAGADVARAWRLEGGVLVSALQLGIAGAVTDMAVAYAKERQQFDRPIGSFQAVKHMLAEMLVRTEMARAAVYAAGVTLDAPEVGDPRRATTVAKVMAGEAAVLNAKDCIQVHGGMGFTWEVDAHLYLKRAWVLDRAFGSPDEHAEAMAAYLARH